MPMPDLAEVRTALEASSPMISSIWALTISGSAAGRSILLMTGTPFRLIYNGAMYNLPLTPSPPVPCESDISPTAALFAGIRMRPFTIVSPSVLRAIGSPLTWRLLLSSPTVTK